MLGSHLPLPVPLNYSIIENWIQTARNPIGLVLGKEDSASIAAFMESSHDIRHIILAVSVRLDDADVVSMLPNMRG